MILWWMDTFGVAGGLLLPASGTFVPMVVRDLPLLNADPRELPTIREA